MIILMYTVDYTLDIVGLSPVLSLSPPGVCVLLGVANPELLFGVIVPISPRPDGSIVFLIRGGVVL